MKMFKFLSFPAASVAVLMMLAAGALAQTGGIEGKVKNRNGDGIAGAVVTIRKDGKDLKSGKADAKGKFKITGVRSGKYNIVFDADGYTAGALFDVEIKDGHTRDLGDGLILYVDLGTQVIVRGHVFDRNGFILPGAKVEMYVRKGDSKFKKVTDSYSNGDGEFGFRHDQKGVNTVRIVAKYKGVTGTKDIPIDIAAVYRTAITLEYPEIKGEN
jgi:hypothetical protein